MGRDLEETLARVAVQLEDVALRERERDRQVQEHGKKIVALETALGMDSRAGDREHEHLRERLKEGDEDLRSLRDRAKEHSGAIKGIRELLSQSSGRRWDFAQIFITGGVGLLSSILVSLIAYGIAMAKLAPMATKGGTP